MFLDIHLEYCDDKGERLRRIAELGKPFSISLVPVLLLPEHPVFGSVYPKDYYYPRKIVDILKQFSRNPNIVFGQQGYSHYCPDCFARKNRRDPWHENRCLYGRRKSVDEQTAFMMKGKRVIEDILDIVPVIYATPNHQSDDNTKEAARELGFRYFADKAVIRLAPYENRELIILPERKPYQRGELFYTHYDQLRENQRICMEIIQNSTPLDSLNLGESQVRIFFNERLKLAMKRARDWKKLIEG